ncbi:MAG TPA: phosphate-starvation-inducible protein PsiE [Candidatus Aveggerthella excrementigallinarum]|nr:phosphate-starvation-inducible protein PsiE [Candidatus Aveggerthella excrementigallinarum]
MPETDNHPSLLRRLVSPKSISRFMQLFLSGVLFVLGAILSILLLMSTWSLVSIVIETHQFNNNEILGAIVTWFLYFEFLALIAKYYQSGLHFPLRYFIYIGITAIIRLIILYHDDPMHTLLFSLSILVLLVALYLANTKLLKRDEMHDDH